jgi:hypothetical protein
MDVTRRPLLTAVRLVLALLTFAAIGTQFAIQVRLGLSVVNFFSYFTNLSNLFAAIILGFGAFQLAAQRAPSASHDLLRTVATLNMAVVGIVFTTLLRDVDLGSLLPWVNTCMTSCRRGGARVVFLPAANGWEPGSCCYARHFRCSTWHMCCFAAQSRAGIPTLSSILPLQEVTAMFRYMRLG